MKHHVNNKGTKSSIWWNFIGKDVKEKLLRKYRDKIVVVTMVYIDYDLISWEPCEPYYKVTVMSESSSCASLFHATHCHTISSKDYTMEKDALRAVKKAMKDDYSKKDI